MFCRRSTLNKNSASNCVFDMSDSFSATDNNEMAAMLEQTVQEVRQVPQEHLPSLLQIIRLFRESVTLKTAEDSFEQGWNDVMTGNTIPISQLWDGIDVE